MRSDGRRRGNSLGRDEFVYMPSNSISLSDNKGTLAGITRYRSRGVKSRGWPP